MSSQPMPRVHYTALSHPSMKERARSTISKAKETTIYLLKAFTQTAIYEMYNVIVCSAITLCLIIYLFVSTYNYTYLVFFDITLCAVLLLDIVANIQSNDINYILTSKYYYDMFLIILDMVMISLIFICHGYGFHVPINWIRIQLLAQDVKYLKPTITWAIQFYNERKLKRLRQKDNTTIRTQPEVNSQGKEMP